VSQLIVFPYDTCAVPNSLGTAQVSKELSISGHTAGQTGEIYSDFSSAFFSANRSAGSKWVDFHEIYSPNNAFSINGSAFSGPQFYQIMLSVWFGITTKLHF
jgi:hypothetical protein